MSDTTMLIRIAQHAYMCLISIMSVFSLGITIQVLHNNPSAYEVVLLIVCALALRALFEIQKTRIEGG